MRSDIYPEGKIDFNDGPVLRPKSACVFIKNDFVNYLNAPPECTADTSQTQKWARDETDHGANHAS